MQSLTEIYEKYKEETRFKNGIPTILVCGETNDSCSCDEIGTKEVYYIRNGKHFREIVCEECFADYDYENKTIIKITKL